MAESGRRKLTSISEKITLRSADTIEGSFETCGTGHNSFNAILVKLRGALIANPKNFSTNAE